MIHEVSSLVSLLILFIKYGVFCPEDVIISSRGGHNINIGDVIEVYHPEDVHHALFLVTTLSDDLQNRGNANCYFFLQSIVYIYYLSLDVISVEQSLAHTFKLQQHKNVIVNVINKEENNCNHDTTVVFFTRIYIDGKLSVIWSLHYFFLKIFVSIN
ncbi:unnamed protein product [Schistosoma margrebowiei]|uniref:IML1 N-terminal double psi beta-barrel domain-containing protein n=1 Tax=Schistosoma margrebowiei TaxID=48269 RepID=A0A183M2G2_9TREM|nr:unnamed protein product [Schistosoma margrebowiei]